MLLYRCFETPSSSTGVGTSDIVTALVPFPMWMVREETIPRVLGKNCCLAATPNSC